MARVTLTHGGRSVYGAPRTRKEKHRFAQETGRSTWGRLRRYKTEQDYYASRSGPVVTIVEPLDNSARPRYADRKLRLKVLRRDRFKCRYCGIDVTMENANIDHVQPFKHGGKTAFENLVAACRFCNEAKANHVTIKAPPIGKATNPFGRPITKT